AAGAAHDPVPLPSNLLPSVQESPRLPLGACRMQAAPPNAPFHARHAGRAGEDLRISCLMGRSRRPSPRPLPCPVDCTRRRQPLAILTIASLGAESPVRAAVDALAARPSPPPLVPRAPYDTGLRDRLRSIEPESMFGAAGAPTAP